MVDLFCTWRKISYYQHAERLSQTQKYNWSLVQLETFIPEAFVLKQHTMAVFIELKVLNLLRVVAHSRWGSDENTLLYLCRSLTRSKLDYGAVVYGSARKSYMFVF